MSVSSLTTKVVNTLVLKKIHQTAAKQQKNKYGTWTKHDCVGKGNELLALFWKCDLKVFKRKQSMNHNKTVHFQGFSYYNYYYDDYYFILFITFKAELLWVTCRQNKTLTNYIISQLYNKKWPVWATQFLVNRGKNWHRNVFRFLWTKLTSTWLALLVNTPRKVIKTNEEINWTNKKLHAQKGKGKFSLIISQCKIYYHDQLRSHKFWQKREKCFSNWAR